MYIVVHGDVRLGWIFRDPNAEVQGAVCENKWSNWGTPRCRPVEHAIFGPGFMDRRVEDVILFTRISSSSSSSSSPSSSNMH